ADGREARSPFYVQATLGESLPPLLAALAKAPVPVAPPTLRLRAQVMDVMRRWSLKELNLKEGDLLVLQACADDFDDVTVLKKPGRSQEVELRVVGRTALDIALNEAQAQIEQEIVRLRNQQREALEKAIPAEALARHQGQLH